MKKLGSVVVAVVAALSSLAASVALVGAIVIGLVVLGGGGVNATGINPGSGGAGFTQAVADTLYCALSGCTMTGGIVSSGGATTLTARNDTATVYLNLGSAGSAKVFAAADGQGVPTLLIQNCDATNGCLKVSGRYTIGESAAPSGSASNTVCYADSTTHALTCSYNNDAFSKVSRASDAITGRFISQSVVTSGTTVSSPALATVADVYACGAGGGGGAAASAAAQGAGGGGGGAGSCAHKVYTTITPSTSYTVAIGTAGTAGTAGGAGGTGGNSTFSDGTTVITGLGGVGGGGSAAGTASSTAGGAGGAAGTNDDGAGSPGEPGQNGECVTGLICSSGGGGTCRFGAGGAPLDAAGAGNVARGTCSGGGGGVVENNSGAVNGGAGTAGVVVVRWSS